jgi:hypothetical protein
MTDQPLAIQIVVTTHKKYRMPEDSIYLPLQVGAAIEKDEDGKPLELGYARDDEGDNISDKNQLFCELTGLYWAWKHLHADYIGLVHYRRYFGSRTVRTSSPADPYACIIGGKELSGIIGRYKVVLPKKRRYYIETLYSHYEHTHYAMHLYETRRILAKLCPEYMDSFDRVLKHTSGYMFNMMIMDRQLLDEYCSWLFRILFELEKRVDVTALSFYQGRYCGRVGEIILNVWIDYQLQSGKLRDEDILVLPYIYTEKVDWKKKADSFLKAKFLHRKYEF